MSDLAILFEARAGATGMNRYRALLSTGEGTFEIGREHVLPAEIRVGKGWRWRWAELNGDGRADILNYYGGSRYKIDENRDGRPRYRNTNDGFRLQVFLSRADGTFAHRPPASLIGTGSHCIGLLGWLCDLADINGDGVTDIVRTNPNDGIQTQVFVGDCSGAFLVGPLTRTAPSGLSPGGRGTSALADVNGDGHGDIVAFREDRRSELPFQVLLSNGDGTFTAIEPSSAFGPAN